MMTPSVLLNKKILVVEDNQFNQETVKDMLELIGCQVELASNGKEALQKYFKNGYDLIIMDVQMPEKNGYEVTQEIRKQEKDQKHTLILAMTAYALVGDRQKCLEAGMDDYLSKPIEMDQLKKKLIELFTPNK